MTTEAQELRGRIVELEKEIAELTKMARQYAAYGDVMRTVAMLPLKADESPSDFHDRVEAAMAFHGHNISSQAIRLITAAFVVQASQERERLIRMFDTIYRQRGGRGRKNMEDGCDCVVCSGARASQEILANEHTRRQDTENDPVVRARIAALDFPVRKALEDRDLKDRDLDEIRETVMETEQDLMELFTRLGLLNGGSIFEMLSVLLDKRLQVFDITDKNIHHLF